MSLKAFHLLFINLSILLAIWTAVWGFEDFRAGGGAGGLVLAGLFALLAVVLAVYGARFRKKFKDLNAD